MPAPIIHIAGGALAYLLSGDLSINRVYMVVGVAALAISPDLDILVPGPHRGFSHSLIFCSIATAMVGTYTPFTYLSTFSVLASHLLLDSLGSGFRTVSWLWPFYAHASEASYRWNDLESVIKGIFKVF